MEVPVSSYCVTCLQISAFVVCKQLCVYSVSPKMSDVSGWFWLACPLHLCGRGTTLVVSLYSLSENDHMYSGLSM